VSRPILVAGIGNVFFGDDGFGVEVVRQLAEAGLPPGVAVVDFGIRGVHLAFELLDPVDLLVAIDATPRGEAPGSLYVIEPNLDATPPDPDAHGMQLPAVLAAVRAMGGVPPRVRVVGCEPAAFEGMGLSAPVRAAVRPAVEIVRRLVREALAEGAHDEVAREVRP
jgi:hydrogenase maturation protease